MVGALGIEPRTNGLKVRCSTAELRARPAGWRLEARGVSRVYAALLPMGIQGHVSEYSDSCETPALCLIGRRLQGGD